MRTFPSLRDHLCLPGTAGTWAARRSISLHSTFIGLDRTFYPQYRADHSSSGQMKWGNLPSITERTRCCSLKNVTYPYVSDITDMTRYTRQPTSTDKH